MSRVPDDPHRSDRPLKSGWTTGACATAATTAAFRALATGAFPDPVTITLPGGETPSFALSRQDLEDGMARAGVIKDAGDDPDVTHGAEIIVTVRRGSPGSGVRFFAGEGVGTVTKPGLPIAPGEPAINPAPRQMMTDAIERIAHECGTGGDAEITVSIPGGEKIAEKTMNGRLGIRGGLSVLGTTGIVKPYSCSAWIHAIRSGIDVARAEGVDHIAGATGKTSEAAVQALLGLPETALIDMGDFVGGMLKYLRDNPVPRLTIAGGFGKLSKLAGGHMDLHSARSQVDFAALSRALDTLGADADVCTKTKNANTTAEVLDLAGPLAGALVAHIAEGARTIAADVAPATDIAVVVVGRDGTILARTDGGP